MVGGHTILQGVRASGVLGHVPADRGHHLAGGVGRIVEILLLGSLGQMKIHHAWFDCRHAILEVEAEDLFHPRKLQDDASFHGNGSSAEASSGTARQKGHFVPLRYGHDLDHILRACRKDNEIRWPGMQRQSIALVNDQLVRSMEDEVGANYRGQFTMDGVSQWTCDRRRCIHRAVIIAQASRRLQRF